MHDDKKYDKMFEVMLINLLIFADGNITGWHYCRESISISLSFCERDLPETGEFPSQTASNAELQYFLCYQHERVVEHKI